MSQQLATLMPLILLIVIMYFLLIRPQKKREKSVAAMRNSVKVGDEIITIGGICGKVVKTKDEVLTIQVGADRVKFEIMRWAVSKVVNEESAPSPSKKAKQEEPQDEDIIAAPKKSLPKRMKKASETESPTSDYAPEASIESEADQAEATDNK
ncbi:preprotein translocase subunit YajC [Anoxybacterium hadale]|uniref:Preprotein translocase subunit YajC n=1 Tax=Anoxybacterium hadale TaxID=3408580 RepID=A0ACD1A8J7_9FIRM|nr:preprotein translocase subunit YajC [Clostridiales bacterium]